MLPLIRVSSLKWDVTADLFLRHKWDVTADQGLKVKWCVTSD